MAFSADIVIQDTSFSADLVIQETAFEADLTIVQGLPGPPGADGAQGEQGPAGPPGTTLFADLTDAPTDNPALAALLQDIDDQLAALGIDINTHAARTDNPHEVSAAQVGTMTSAEITALVEAVEDDLAALSDVAVTAPVAGTAGYLPVWGAGRTLGDSFISQSARVDFARPINFPTANSTLGFGVSRPVSTLLRFEQNTVNSANAFGFYTNTGYVAWLTSTGLGIGTTSPAAPLHAALSTGAAQMILEYGTDGTKRALFGVDSAANLSISTPGLLQRTALAGAPVFDIQRTLGGGGNCTTYCNRSGNYAAYQSWYRGGTVLGQLGYVNQSGNPLILRNSISTEVRIETGGNVILRCSPTGIGFHGRTPAASQELLAPLTDSTTGTPGTTISAISGSGADSAINDALASLITRITSLESKLVATTLVTQAS